MYHKDILWKISRQIIRKGKTNKEIAEEYNLKVRTIETHRMNMIRKFNVSDFDELKNYQP